MPSAKELAELREEVRRLRGRIANLHPRDVEPLLDQLSERRRGGREPYVWKAAKGRRPVTVPRHGSKPLTLGVARNVLDDIEALIDELEAGE